MKLLISYFILISCMFHSLLAMSLFPIQFPLLSSPPPPLRPPLLAPSASYLSAPIIQDYYPLYVPSKDLSSLFDESLGDYSLYQDTPQKQRIRENGHGHGHGHGQGYRHGSRNPYRDNDEYPHYGPSGPYVSDDEDDSVYGQYGPGGSHAQNSGRNYHGPPRHHRTRYGDGPYQYGPHRDHFGPGPDRVKGKQHDYVLPRNRHREFYGPPSDENPRAFSNYREYQIPSDLPSDLPSPLPSQPCPKPPCDDQQASRIESLSIPLNPQQSPVMGKPGQKLQPPVVTHFIETPVKQ